MRSVFSVRVSVCVLGGGVCCSWGAGAGVAGDGDGCAVLLSVALESAGAAGAGAVGYCALAVMADPPIKSSVRHRAIVQMRVIVHSSL